MPTGQVACDRIRILRDYSQAEELMPKIPLKWSYGVLTVPSRRNTLLPITLRSLREGGFDNPRLFVDGSADATNYFHQFGLATTARDQIRVFGNWVLSLWELYLREPTADRFAVFQDDLITYKNLRQYLECCPYPDRGYLNLYTFPSNQELAPKDELGRHKDGWYLSNQLGRGAVGLIFSNEAARHLLASPYMVDRPLDPMRGWKSVDGGIIMAMNPMSAQQDGTGWPEWVHHPSLVQHTGHVSTTGNAGHKQAESFRGEDYDAREIDNCKPATAATVST